jgi:hypothetical protein
VLAATAALAFLANHYTTPRHKRNVLASLVLPFSD